MAGNQLGKTLSGSYESTVHLTGDYPKWWTGYRLERPAVMWVGGLSNELVRDGPQRLLFGRPGEWGSGMIPERMIENVVRGRGVADVIDYAKIRHRDGLSTLVFKNYEQAPLKWASETIDVLWYDEEPTYGHYDEGQTRLNNGGNRDPESGKNQGGISYMTMTPLLGMSDVVRLYYPEAASPEHSCIQMEIDEVDHYTEERKREIVAAYAPWQREARSKGIPVLGSGRVFPVSEEAILIDHIDIHNVPAHWKRINGLDFGWDHPTAAARCFWDAEADVFYVLGEYAERETVIPAHAATLKGWGNSPWAWPHDGHQHDGSHSGDDLRNLYAGQGLRMLPEHAQTVDGGNSLEAAIQEMLTYMVSGRFKVSRVCRGWLDEFRLYHRKNGKIVKENDDRISASRYAFMMRRFARTGEMVRMPTKLEAYDPFGGQKSTEPDRYWWPTKEGYNR